MLLLLHFGLLAVAFIFHTINFARGAAKERILRFLSFAWVALVVVAFAAFGLRDGVIAFGAFWVYTFVTRPVAARVAARLLGFGSPLGGGSYPGLPNPQLQSICEVLGKPRGPEELMRVISAGVDPKEHALEALLSFVEAQPATAEVMRRHGADRDTVRRRYHDLCALGFGQWSGAHFIAASAIAYPQPLELLLSKTDSGESSLDVGYRIFEHFTTGSPLKSDPTG